MRYHKADGINESKRLIVVFLPLLYCSQPGASTVLTCYFFFPNTL